ncbi:P63C domain-containing protein [Sphingobacterium anhuiense]|uniref:P63C domain-containing protein n=1 Tax=Sphingobacterium anhuiense TaxID=493780 RepID=UPI003C304DF9
MENNSSLFATHTSDKTPLVIGNVEIPAYVLNNGQRVFSQNGIQKALGFTGTSGDWLLNFVKSKQLQVEKNAGLLESVGNRVTFNRVGAGGSVTTTYGYDATILIDICDAILEAKNAGKLSAKNKIYADQAGIIIRSVAKVGIIALIDEATGYQYDREKDALQVILQAYINEELLKWQKMFPDTFYYEIFRLNGWDYTVSGIKRRPGVIGKWTNELIYKQLPKGILDELKSKTPKSADGNYTARFFQSLTPDIGHPALTAQLYKVIGLMNISNNWTEFKSHFNKMVDRSNGQTELDFDRIEKEIIN